MKELGPSQIRRIMNSHPLFSLPKFKQIEDKQGYITTLLIEMFIKHQIKNSMCNLTQLTFILNELGFDFTLQQKHQIFIFSLSEQKFNSKNKLFNIINQERKKINIDSIAQWIINNIQKIRIKQQTHKSRPELKIRAVSQMKSTKLPLIKPRSKLEEKLEPLIGIFDHMKKLRQQNGLIPYNFDEDQDALDDFSHIPYDPTMGELHTQLGQLKLKAEDQLKQIIELARQDPKIRIKLEEGVEKFQKLRIEANQKVGRAGAINAQKRLAERRKKELQKLRTIKFQYADDMVRASNVYRLLNNPSPKIKPVY